MRIDCHCDTVLHYDKHDSLNCIPQAHLDFQRLREYLDLSFFAFWIDEDRFGEGCPEELRRVWKLLQQDVANQGDLEILLYKEQLDKDFGPGLLYAMEGAAPLGERGAYLDEYYQQGLRVLGLTWNKRNGYGAGAGAEGSLTQWGEEIIARCNSLGILLDGAHLNDDSFDRLLQLSAAPCIDSHTVCRSVCSDFSRSLTDRQLEELAAAGGVACICMVPEFLGDGGGLEQFCRHVEYAVALIGGEHVGIGGDYDGCTPHPELAGIQFLPDVYRRLTERGMKEYTLAQVAGESVRNLLRQVLPSRNDR